VKSIIKSALWVFVLSVMAWGIWLYEIVDVIGWPGLRWLSQNMYSPYLITLLSAVAYSIPFWSTQKISKAKVIVSVFLLYSIATVCFEAGRFFCYLLYCRVCAFSFPVLILLLVMAFCLFPLLGIVFWWVTNKYLVPCRKRNILLIAIFASLMLPLSLLTIRIQPGIILGSDWVDAVKMGYPAFWIINLLGASGLVIAKRMKLNNT